MLSEYVNDESLQGMQRCQLEILKEVKRVCEKHGITFYLAYGTCIGAIRHKGFIPWDDDIDIFMDRENLAKFEKLQTELKPNYTIQNHFLDKEYGLLITRVRDSNTTLVEEDHKDRLINHGVYIDIYPLMNYPIGFVKTKLVSSLILLSRLFAYNAPPMRKGKFFTIVSKMLLSITPRFFKEAIVNKIWRLCSSFKETGYVSTEVDFELGVFYKKEWFGIPIWVDFEGEKMPVPSNYHSCLTQEYGDYMKLPPVDKRVVHHNYLFLDLHTSYTEYAGIKYAVKNKK